MEIRAGLLGMALLACAAPPASAQNEAYRPEFRQCMDRDDTTVGMSICLTAEHAYWDDELNERYRALVAAWDPEGVEALRRTQRAWLAWRELECDLRASVFEGGSFASIAFGYCMLDETLRRAQTLGDLGPY